MAVDERDTFVAALNALHSHSTSSDDRKRANDWLLAFQRTSACWGVAKQLLLDPAAASDVQLFAAQTLKSRARLMRSAPADQNQKLQCDLMQILAQLANSNVQLTKQLCLALVDTSLPSPNTLGHLISALTANLPGTSALLALEYLADGVSSLTHFGSGGSNEERIEALAELKAQLRNHAGGVFSWLSNQAQQGPASSAQHAANVLNCFNAWTRLGGLHNITQQKDLESLVGLALAHLRDPDSAAFEASADALSEVVDYCPDTWLHALHDPLVALVDVAAAVAAAGRATAAEHICRVIAAYAALRVMGQLANLEPCRPLLNSLLRLATLAQIGDSGDPACWPALKAWSDIVDAVLGTGVDNGHYEDEGAPDFQPASSVAAAPAAAQVPKDIQTLLDQLFVNLLQNMVSWQQQAAGSNEAPMDAFTPAFMGTLTDFLSATCDVLGPNRYAAILCMMMEQQQQQDTQAGLAVRVAAAAMHAVSSAGGRRLSSEPGALQMLAVLLHKTASMASGTQQQQQQRQSKVLLMPFCCAAAASGRSVLVYMCSSNQGQEAERFIASTLEIALQGLAAGSRDQDTQDLQTPAAMAIKSVMQGAQASGLQVPLPCIQALVSAVQQHTKLGTWAESNLVLALSSAILSLQEADGTRQRVQLESLQHLVKPLQTLLRQVVQQQEQQQAVPEEVGERLRVHLRVLELLLQNALSPGGEDAESHDQEHAQQPVPGQPTVDQGALSWLSDMLLQEVWPLLAQVLSKDGLPGGFLTPLCKLLAALMRALPARCQDSLPSILQAMVSAMFRPGGGAAHQALSVALEVYSTPGAQCLELLQQAVQHILSEPRVVSLGSLGAADQHPELAECCAKVSSSYVRHLLLPVAGRSGEAATSAVGAISRLAAACNCSHQRGAALAALTASADLLGLAVSAVKAAQASRQQQEQQQAEMLTRAVVDNGSVVCLGIIGGLLSSYPLSRLHKASAILAELALLAGTRTNNDAAQQQQMVSSWLSGAAAGCQLTSAEQQSISQLWTPAILEAAAGLSASSREQGLSSRGLKKLLRDFADVHAREA